MGRSVPRSSPKPPPKPPPKPRSGLCPELLADFRIPKPPGVLAGGTEGSFLCSPSSRFSGRGGGVGNLPRAWRRGWGASDCTKNCPLGPCEHNLQAPLFYVVGQNSARADSGIMGWADIWGDIWVDL